jgi:hypothetical protein
MSTLNFARAISLAVAWGIGISITASAQTPCPSCQPCNTAPVVQMGSSGPLPPTGTGAFPAVVVPTFDTSLGQLTGVQVSVTAEALDRKYSVENTNPSISCGGDPSLPASLDMSVNVHSPVDFTEILSVDSSIDPNWHSQDVHPVLGPFDCCLDDGECDNDPGLGFDFQCCPGCPVPMGTGPIVPPNCPLSPPPCTAPSPQKSGYHRTFANAFFGTTTACLTSDLGVFRSSSGPTVSFPVTALAPSDTGSSLCGGAADKHWASKVKVTVIVTYTYCPNGGPSFCPICFGDSVLVPCPCSNEGLPAHGCNNSAATGGARLTGAGSTSPDTVVLTSSGELATALSILLQGDSLLAQPAFFGDGLRCVGGTLLRLYTKNAASGSVSTPGAGDPSISARSAALGDPIAPGSTRSYQTYYRDPSPTFCPAPQGNTWNVSSGLTIAWR